jgi:hypothetical protein
MRLNIWHFSKLNIGHWASVSASIDWDTQAVCIVGQPKLHTYIETRDWIWTRDPNGCSGFLWNYTSVRKYLALCRVHKLQYRYLGNQFGWLGNFLHIKLKTVGLRCYQNMFTLLHQCSITLRPIQHPPPHWTTLNFKWAHLIATPFLWRLMSKVLFTCSPSDNSNGSNINLNEITLDDFESEGL